MELRKALKTCSHAKAEIFPYNELVLLHITHRLHRYTDIDTVDKFIARHIFELKRI